jgi:FkbM family methyltransferase
MMRVISSPSISTTGLATLIFAIAFRTFAEKALRGAQAWGRSGATYGPARRFPQGRERPLPQGASGGYRKPEPARQRIECVEFPGLARARGAIGRFRREMRRRMLEPIVLRNRSLRETVLNALSARGHLVYCQQPEGHFFVDPADRVVGHWLMWREGWQRQDVARITEILAAAGRLPAEAVFIDAGANIGTHTIYALQTGRFARALACEPEPKNQRLLEMNMTANGLSARVRLIPKALGAQPGTATLHLHPRNKGGHSLRWNPSYDGQATVDVPVVRLDALLHDEGIAPETIGVVWIDTEGFEPQVVEGLGDYLGRVPLAIEYAPKRYAPADAARLRELLQQHYKALYLLDRDQPAAQPMSALATVTGITDMLVF